MNSLEVSNNKTEFMAKLYLGDCLKVLDKVRDGSIDLVLCDPPYGTTACKWDSIIPFNEMWAQLLRVTKPTSAICIFGTEPFSSYLRMSNVKMFRYDWIWHKSRPSGMALSKYQPMRNHETISVFYKKNPVFNKQMEPRAESAQQRYKQGKFNRFGSGNSTTGIGKIQGHLGQVSELRNPTTVRFFQCVTDRSENKHPTQKPVPLMEYLVKTYTNPGDSVLDFTMGSGSSGVAAIKLNRLFTGIENDEKYFGIASERIGSA